MDQTLINRYQPGGDLYKAEQNLFGADGANAIANAALTGDETQITAVREQLQFGADKPTNTAAIFTNQILTDPLAAPLAGANNLIGNSVLSFLKNPWVLVAVAVIVFGAMGGFAWIGRKSFKS